MELDKVIIPSPKLESSSSQKYVPVTTTPISEEANDDDHVTSDQVTTEPRNCALLNMVRSMTSLTDLPLSFWGYALETTTFTLNRALSKSVETTPYELWFGKKPKLSFLKV